MATEMPVYPEMLESAKADTLKVQELMTFWGMGNALHKGGIVSPGLWLRAESLAVLSVNKPGVIHTDLTACNAYKDALARDQAVKSYWLLEPSGSELRAIPRATGRLTRVRDEPRARRCPCAGCPALPRLAANCPFSRERPERELE